MKTLTKLALAAFLAGGAAIATAAPASAEVGITFGIGGGPGYYHSYDYGRPCWFYRRWDIPAPARCYRDFYGYYGSDIFLNGDFVYRDRDDFGHWRHRWHDHDDWGRGDRHDRDGDWDRGDRHRGDGDHDRDGGRWHDHDRR